MRGLIGAGVEAGEGVGSGTDSTFEVIFSKLQI